MICENLNTDIFFVKIKWHEKYSIDTVISCINTYSGVDVS